MKGKPMSMGREVPPRIKPKGDSGYFQQLTRAVFQSGFSWAVIRDKWPNFVQAFDGFSVDAVADYGDGDLERLLSDPGIVRNGRKIVATIENARTIQHLAQTHGSFHNYLRSLDNLTYAEKRKELTKQFRNLGPTGVFVFLWCVDEPVPSWEERNK